MKAASARTWGGAWEELNMPRRSYGLCKAYLLFQSAFGTSKKYAIHILTARPPDCEIDIAAQHETTRDK
eukprot:235582-Pleurochrysis_carterae.AAC.4